MSTNRWLDVVSESGLEPECIGVLLKRSRDNYACEPNPIHPGLLRAVQTLNVAVAFTMSTDTTDIILAALEPSQTEIILRNGSQIQVLKSLSQISSSSSSLVKRYQYAALVREEQILLVWHDDLDRIIPHSVDIESRLLTLVS